MAVAKKPGDEILESLNLIEWVNNHPSFYDTSEHSEKNGRDVWDALVCDTNWTADGLDKLTDLVLKTLDENPEELHLEEWNDSSDIQFLLACIPQNDICSAATLLKIFNATGKYINDEDTQVRCFVRYNPNCPDELKAEIDKIEMTESIDEVIDKTLVEDLSNRSVLFETIHGEYSLKLAGKQFELLVGGETELSTYNALLQNVDFLATKAAPNDIVNILQFAIKVRSFDENELFFKLWDKLIENGREMHRSVFIMLTNEGYPEIAPYLTIAAKDKFARTRYWVVLNPFVSVETLADLREDEDEKVRNTAITIDTYALLENLVPDAYILAQPLLSENEKGDYKQIAFLDLASGTFSSAVGMIETLSQMLEGSEDSKYNPFFEFLLKAPSIQNLIERSVAKRNDLSEEDFTQLIYKDMYGQLLEFMCTLDIVSFLQNFDQDPNFPKGEKLLVKHPLTRLTGEGDEKPEIAPDSPERDLYMKDALIQLFGRLAVVPIQIDGTALDIENASNQIRRIHP